MTDLINGIILLTLSGLAFVSYSLPSAARIIIQIMALLIALGSLGFAIYEAGRADAVHEIFNNIKLKRDLPIKNMGTATGDTIKYMFEETEVLINERDTMLARLEQLSIDLKDKGMFNMLFFLFCFLGLAVFFFLSILFQVAKRISPETAKQKNETPNKKPPKRSP